MDDIQFDNYQTRTVRNWIDENKSLYLTIEDMSKANLDVMVFADKLHRYFTELYGQSETQGKYIDNLRYALENSVNWVQIAQSFRNDLVAKKF